MGTTDHLRISKREFISRVAVRSGLSIRIVNQVYEELFGELTDAVSRGETVVFTGFGRFYRQSHKGHKVRFGKKHVEDYPVLKFSASRGIKRRLGEDQLETAEPIESTADGVDADVGADVSGSEKGRELAPIAS